MPPRPFPHLFRIGCDICKISRIGGITSSGAAGSEASYTAFLRRILTKRERDYFHARFRSTSGREAIAASHIAKSRFLAGRWAAKEACIKAVKPRKLTLHEVEIWPDESGEVYAIIFEGGGDAQLQADLAAKIQLAKLAQLASPGVKADDPKADFPDAEVRSRAFQNALEDQNAREVQDIRSFQNALEDQNAREDSEMEEQGNWERTVKSKAAATAKQHDGRKVPSHEHVNGQVARVSISHEEDYAIAVAMAVSEPAAGDVGGEAAARTPGGL